MSDDKVEGYDTERIDEVYANLGSMTVKLDDDPLLYGPKRLNAKVAETRAMLSRCERVFLQVSQDLHRLKRQHRALELDYDIRMSDLLANDPQVRANHNIADREATAKTKLEADIRELSRMDGLIVDLETLMAVIKAKRTDLKDSASRLRDQIRLCQEEIGLGGRWGSRVPGAVEVTPGLGTKEIRQALTMAEVLSDVAGEINLARSSGDFPEGAAGNPEVSGPVTENSPDACEVCHGAKGGVPGNENIVNGKVTCDHCTVEAKAPEPVPEEAPPVLEQSEQSETPVTIEAEAAALDPPASTATTTEVDEFLTFGLDTPAPTKRDEVKFAATDSAVDLDSLLDSFGEG